METAPVGRHLRAAAHPTSVVAVVVAVAPGAAAWLWSHKGPA